MKKPIAIAYLCALLMIVSNSFVHAQNITVSLAGDTAAAYSGDGGFCTLSKTSGPTDVCMDAAGNIYFADNGNNRIRKISAKTGVVTTYAGGGASTADGVPAITASLTPWYMCMDATGNIYVSTGNQVRKIAAATGIITTIAGTGTAGYSGDGGAAIAAELTSPGGICMDAPGNLYIVDGGATTIKKADSINNSFSVSSPAVTYIRKITPSGIISTIAGTGIPGYSGDGGPATAAQISSSIAICVNASGDVFFSDQPGSISFGGAYIRKINGATGIISTIAGTGGFPANGNGVPAITACVGNVYGICCDTGGNLYFNDFSCSCRKIDMTTGIINTIAGYIDSVGYNGDGSNSLNELFNWPSGVFIDATSGNILVADHLNNKIRKAIQLTHTPSFAYGNGQFISLCPGSAFSLDPQMPVTDLDSGQTETWTVITAPLHGTMLGFPATAISGGQSYMVTTSGTSYTPYSSYTGNDSFEVQVSDGTLSSIVTVYVSVTCGDTSTHVNALATSSAFSLFPNPASSVLNMQWANAQNNNAPVVITDITGRELYRDTWNSNNSSMQVDISGFPAGMYLVSVNGANVRKFVKE